MKEIVFESNNKKQTKQIGKILAEELNNKRSLKSKKEALVVGLAGDLGSGKTTFVQGMAGGLGIKNKITSPTFVIMKKFRIKGTSSNKAFFDFFYHFDFYRLNSKKDFKIAGIESALREKRSLVAVEWPNRIKGFTPANFLKIEIIHKGLKKRSIKISFK